jgi:hypothetical protein
MWLARYHVLDLENETERTWLIRRRRTRLCTFDGGQTIQQTRTSHGARHASSPSRAQR